MVDRDELCELIRKGDELTDEDAALIRSAVVRLTSYAPVADDLVDAIDRFTDTFNELLRIRQTGSPSEVPLVAEFAIFDLEALFAVCDGTAKSATRH
jgi:hypothetical protein